MSLKIRLARGGAKKRPYYSIVIADSRSPRDGRFIEKVGFYNPMVGKDADNRLSLNIDRIKYWLSVGAIATDRVNKFLAAEKLVEAREIYPQTKKHLQSEKTLEMIKDKAEKVAALAEATKQAEAEAKEAAAQAEADANDAAAAE